jgi:heat shock protein HslJ
MSNKIASQKPFTGWIAALTAGSMSIAAAPMLAQQPLETSAPIQMAQSASAIAGSWRLANMTESPFPTPMVPSTDLTAEFSDGNLFGSGGCNRFRGGYQTEGDRLTIGPLASTFKACEQSLMDQEFRYLKALQGAQRYEVNDQNLTIYYQAEQKSGVLRFTAQAVRGLW